MTRRQWLWATTSSRLSLSAINYPPSPTSAELPPLRHHIVWLGLRKVIWRAWRGLFPSLRYVARLIPRVDAAFYVVAASLRRCEVVDRLLLFIHPSNREQEQATSGN